MMKTTKNSSTLLKRNKDRLPKWWLKILKNKRSRGNRRTKLKIRMLYRYKILLKELSKKKLSLKGQPLSTKKEMNSMK